MKIYTRTGDKGETGLWGGSRISKDAVRINAYGTVDECNAVLGIARTLAVPPDLDAMLAHIQNQLFIVGADLAAPADQAPAIARVSADDAAVLERWIDELESSLPPLKQFIIPGGSPAAAYLHLARTVCRRAERWTVALAREEPSVAPVVVYLNRLSDFLFVAARTANRRAGVEDRPWDNPRLKKKP